MPPSANPQRILLLDDHPGSCAAMCFVLRLRGHTCLAVRTVDDALVEIVRFQPDVILFEWHLARGRVHGIANALRSSIPPGRRVRLIIMSVMDEPSGFRDNEPIDAYFLKPINMPAFDQLLATPIS